MPDLVPLSIVWRPETFAAYKIHFARMNEDGQKPLDLLASDFVGEWKGWQEWRGQKNEFNRDFIFSLAQDYRRPDHWLFGGIWRVVERHPDRYEVALSDELLQLVKRLWIRIDHRDRATRCRMETYFDRTAGCCGMARTFERRIRNLLTSRWTRERQLCWVCLR